MEEWREIKGYEGMYSVSNYGRVKAHARDVMFGTNVRKTEEHILKQTDNGHGYKIVSLSVNRKRRNHYVHRLVANAFITNSNKDAKHVHHLDDDPANNTATNLSWVTVKENIGTKHHRRLNGISHSKPVVAIKNDEILEFESVNSVKRAGFNPASVNSVLRGDWKHYRGYTWKYKENKYNEPRRSNRAAH